MTKIELVRTRDATGDCYTLSYQTRKNLSRDFGLNLSVGSRVILAHPPGGPEPLGPLQQLTLTHVLTCLPLAKLYGLTVEIHGAVHEEMLESWSLQKSAD